MSSSLGVTLEAVRGMVAGKNKRIRENFDKCLVALGLNDDALQIVPMINGDLDSFIDRLPASWSSPSSRSNGIASVLACLRCESLAAAARAAHGTEAYESALRRLRKKRAELNNDAAADCNHEEAPPPSCYAIAPDAAAQEIIAQKDEVIARLSQEIVVLAKKVDVLTAVLEKLSAENQSWSSWFYGLRELL